MIVALHMLTWENNILNNGASKSTYPSFTLTDLAKVNVAAPPKKTIIEDPFLILFFKLPTNQLDSEYIPLYSLIKHSPFH